MAISEILDGVFLNINPSTKYKTNYISFGFLNNLTKENASNSTLLANVLKIANDKYKDQISVSKKLEDLYGAKIRSSIKNFGETHCVYFSAEYLNSKYTLNFENLDDEIFTFLEDMFTRPLIIKNGFSDDIVNTEKENLINKINSEFDDKKTYSLNKCIEIMCKDEPYSVLESGDVESVAKITSTSLLEFYKEFMKKSIVYISYCGDGNSDIIIEKCKALFLEKRVPVSIKSTYVYNKKECDNFGEKQPIIQGKLSMGFRTGVLPKDSDYMSLLLFMFVFATSPNSRLFENVREKLSLCYYCAGSLVQSKGIMFICSGVETQNKDKAINEINYQLEDLRKGNITEYELKVAKNHFKNSYKSLNDDNVSMTFFNLGQFISGANKTNIDLLNEVESISSENIKNVANKIYLDTIYFLASDKESEINE